MKESFLEKYFNPVNSCLILAETYPPLKDGVAHAAQAVGEGLAARGYKVTVGTGFCAERISQPADANPMVHQFKVSGSIRLGDHIRGETEAFKQLVADYRGDFIICHHWPSWTTDLAREAFDGTPAQKILLSHGLGAHRVPWHRTFPWGLSAWLKWLPYILRLPLTMRQFDQLIFLSRKRDFGRFFDHTLAWLTGYKKVSIIPNGADPQKFAGDLPAFRQKHGLGDEIMFLYVGTFTVGKNQEMALRAFRRAGLGKAALVFIGPEFNEYARRVMRSDENDAPKGKVLFLEKISREETCAAFRASDIVVMSPRPHAETQPLVLLEAMACEKPFLSTDVGCASEMPGGLVVHTEEEMSAAMQQLSRDSDRRLALGLAGRKAVAETYNWEKIIDAYEALFKRLANENPLER